ncbi:type IV secretory system conjugative DNA transfer family protein [Nonomuraea sp. NPDC050790]|uniref:type IV secretory system conjugative DNA transfer family protein n=1 Tax=Nonomuraea sp. NPDC050790 TaxID=3364371 RepID=UPI0037A24196
MTAAIWIGAGGVLLLGLVLGSRWLQARAWRRSLAALAVSFPPGLKPHDVSAWLAVLAAGRVPVALEIVATRERITHYLLVPKTQQAAVMAESRAVLPGLRLDEAPDYLTTRRETTAAGELRLTNLSRRLAADRAETAAAALLGALGYVAAGETVRVQWLLVGVRTPQPRAAGDPAKDLARAEQSKHGEPLMLAVGRIGVTAPKVRRAWAVLGQVAGTLRLLDAPGVAVVRRSVPSWWVGSRLGRRAWPLTAWPVVVNASEAAGLVGVPMGGVRVPGLVLGQARQLPPPASLPTSGGTVVAVSNYPGMSGRRLVLRPEDRLRHVYALGPTGVGKSTLLANMALGDLTVGYGLVLIDPKGDLVETVLARVPDEHAERVIVLDPSQTSRPLGFNPLAAGRGEQARELAVDRTLHIFRELYRAFWGPRTDDVLRAALLTLASVPAPDGSAFTLCEVPELLSSSVLRQFVVRNSMLPEVLRSYWTSFEAMSEGEQQAHVGPVMNKLRALTMRTVTRLMVGQNTGLDLGEVMRRRQVLLVSLAKGSLGEETATLVGALLVASVWQATLGRVAVAPERRRPFFVYLDEFQDVVRLSDSLSDLLSQARGLGVGAVLANQYLAQLPEGIRTAVLGTVRTQIVFQVEHDDGRLLERRWAPHLATSDLTGLAVHEIAMRPCVDGAVLSPVTGTTLPLGEPVRDAATLAAASHERYGVARETVEAGLQARLVVPGQRQPLGRVRREIGS